MVDMRSFDEVFQKMRPAFLERGNPLYIQLKALSDRSGSDHLEYLFDQEAAVCQKIRRTLYVGRMVDFKSTSILDLGSGCGLAANVLAFVGARQVTGIELDDGRRAVGEFLQREVFHVENVSFLPTTDALPKESHDSVLLINVISHLQKPIDMLLVLRDLLRKHGTLFIEDNNNFQNLLVRRRLKSRVWPGEKRDGELVYAKMRREYLAQKHPELSPQDHDYIIDNSYGMICVEIEDVVEHYRKFKSLHFSDTEFRRYAPINPDNGMYHENAFSPQILRVLLFNLGFYVETVQPKHLFDYKVRGMVSAVFRRFPRLSLYASPAFEIVAMKR